MRLYLVIGVTICLEVLVLALAGKDHARLGGSPNAGVSFAVGRARVPANVWST